MTDLTCITDASCEPGDHTYSWPCCLASMPKERRNVAGTILAAPLIWALEAIGWARQVIVTIAERWAPGEDVAGEEEA